MKNITDALFIERTKELRLISDVIFNGEKVVFSVRANSQKEAHDLLDVLGVTCPTLESQLIDAGLVASNNELATLLGH